MIKVPKNKEDETHFERGLSIQSVGKTMRIPKVLLNSGKDEILVMRIPDGLDKVFLDRIVDLEDIESAVRLIAPGKKIVSMVRKENGKEKLILEIE